MKNKKSIKNYYEEYLEICSSVAPTSIILDLRKLMKKERPENNLSLPFGTCLIDYSRREYKYVSDNCQELLSYSNDEYKEGGLDFNELIFHPEDRAIFSEQVFKDIREYWSRIPPEEISSYRFSFNHRYFRRDGTTSQILQHGTYMEPNDSGIPVLNLLTYTDIGDFKTDTSIILTILRLVKGLGYVKVFSKSYSQLVKTVLSKRESEILLLCLDGLSSKMIADKLFLSIQTIKNHMRNMREKTSARNTVELISLSIKNNWI